MRKNGHGIIGMKLIGQGKFTNIEDRRKSLKWVMQNNLADAVVLGMKSKEEIDEAIANINSAFMPSATDCTVFETMAAAGVQLSASAQLP